MFEHNGNVSFLPFAENRPYTPKDAGAVEPAELLYDVILDGYVVEEALKKGRQDRAWLQKADAGGGLSGRAGDPACGRPRRRPRDLYKNEV